MDIRELTPAYAVSPQILPEHLKEIAAAGYTTILCNRPDGEIPGEICASAMEEAATALGLTFVVNPLVHGEMTPDIIELQRATIEQGGRTLAYCASGTRSTICWMLGEAPTTAPETLLSLAAEAGYQLGQLHPHLAALHQR